MPQSPTPAFEDPRLESLNNRRRKAFEAPEFTGLEPDAQRAVLKHLEYDDDFVNSFMSLSTTNKIEAVSKMLYPEPKKNIGTTGGIRGPLSLGQQAGIYGKSAITAGPEIAGSTALGIMAAPLGPVTSAGASGVGAAGGRGLSNTMRTIFPELDMFARNAGQSPLPTTSEAAAKDMGSAFMLGAGSELFGLGLARGAKAVIPARMPVADLAEQQGVKLLTGEATDSTILRTLDTVAESSAFGKKPMLDIRKEQNTQLLKKAEEIANNIGNLQSDVEVGTALQAAFRKESARQATQVVKPLYDEFYAAVNKETVSLVNMKQAAKELQTELGHANRFLPELDAALTDVLQTPDNITIGEARAIRSALLTQIRKNTDLVTNQETRINQLIEAPLDKEIRTVAERKGVLPLLDKANSLHKERVELFNRSVIKQLAKNKQPELLATQIWKPGSITTARTVRKALANDPKAWTALQRRGWENLWEKAIEPSSSTPEQHILVGKRLARLWNDLGEDLQKELVAPDLIEDVRKFIKTGAGTGTERITQMEKGTLGTTQGVALGVTLGGAVIPNENQRFSATAAGILLFPALTSRLLTSKAGLRLLTRGWEVPSRSAEGAAFLSRVVTMTPTPPKQKEKATAPPPKPINMRQLKEADYEFDPRTGGLRRLSE